MALREQKINAEKIIPRSLQIKIGRGQPFLLSSKVEILSLEEVCMLKLRIKLDKCEKMRNHLNISRQEICGVLKFS